MGLRELFVEFGDIDKVNCRVVSDVSGKFLVDPILPRSVAKDIVTDVGEDLTDTDRGLER